MKMRINYEFKLIVFIALLLTVCNAFQDDDAKKIHEDVTRKFEFNIETISALIIAALASAASMAVGVGGGGILVPIFNIILHFGIKQSTAVSQAVICCSGIGAVVFSLRNSLPSHPEKPLADLQLALLFTPALLFGVSIGVLANTLLPPVLISLTIITILSYISYRMFLTANRLSQEEKEKRTEEEEDLSNIQYIEEQHSSIHHYNISTTITAPPPPPPPPMPWFQLSQLLIMWIIFSSLQYGKSRFDKCSIEYISFFSAQALFALLCIIWFAYNHNTPSENDDIRGHAVDSTNNDNSIDRRSSSAPKTRSTLQKTEVTSYRLSHDDINSSTPLERPLLMYDYSGDSDGDDNDDVAIIDINAQQTNHHRHTNNNDTTTTTTISPSQSPQSSSSSWSVRKLIFIILFIIFAGTLAGIIGMGGGFILNPLLLELNVHPLVSSSTSGLMVLFASSSATFSFLADGRLNIEYALVYGSICGVSSFLGVGVLSRMAAKKGSSVLVYLLAVILAMGAVSTLLFHGRHIIDDLFPHHHGHHNSSSGGIGYYSSSSASSIGSFCGGNNSSSHSDELMSILY